MTLTVDGQTFSWDLSKSIINIEKHGITFQEAATVFKDDNAVMYDDDAHSDDEERFIIIGASLKDDLLFVCHCYKDDDIIRIISARKADNRDKQLYMGGA